MTDAVAQHPDGTLQTGPPRLLALRARHPFDVLPPVGVREARERRPGPVRRLRAQLGAPPAPPGGPRLVVKLERPADWRASLAEDGAHVERHLEERARPVLLQRTLEPLGHASQYAARVPSNS